MCKHIIFHCRFAASSVAFTESISLYTTYQNNCLNTTRYKKILRTKNTLVFKVYIVTDKNINGNPLEAIVALRGQKTGCIFLKLFSIRVKELFELIVLREKADGCFLLLKPFI